MLNDSFSNRHSTQFSKILVDFTLSESLQKWMFEESPLDNLEFVKIDRKEWGQKYGIPQEIQF